MSRRRRGAYLALLLPLLAGCAMLNPLYPLTATWDVAMAAQDISPETEYLLGDLLARKLEERYGRYDDPRAVRYLNCLGFALLKATDRQGCNWRFAILDTAEVNAFACPGGAVYITRGLWERVANEAELAGVLGHEMAHVVRRDTVLDARVAAAAAVALQATVGQMGTPGERLAQWLLEEILLKGYSRDTELAADRLGLRYAAVFGYYPYGLPDFLDRELQARSLSTGSLFSAYPETAARVRILRRTVQDAFPGAAAAPRLAERLHAWRTPTVDGGR